MKKFYYLESCSTCKRIMKELKLADDVEMREIKSSPITALEADSIAGKVGSYEAMFSKRAMKYRSLGLHEKELSEKDYRRYLLEEYTFLKRPVMETDNRAVAGNSKKAVAEMKSLL
ncbi:MAG: arsenate reductase family protein [Cryomorphaceae bacterium]|nr:hypothetical protein [Flavobacteriales bacterium]